MRVPEVRLVGPNGEQVGIVRIEQAMKLATESELDLVEVAPEARPPVVKLMDFGKFKYESAMKERAARKNQANTVLKEIRYRLKIDDHDYATKTGHVTRFLKAGDKVKVMIMFRGREQSRPEMGLRLLQRVAADVQDLGSVESTPRVDGRNMVMVIGPHKKKAEVKTEAKAAKQAEKDAASAPADGGSSETVDATVSTPTDSAPADTTADATTADATTADSTTADSTTETTPADVTTPADSTTDETTPAAGTPAAAPQA
ncbi:translation initiation factor IF-3 [Aquipuribacter hungaricus]|uniref:translation initiation factor IF-3 n=1 Tax=Aquipuribacter hungaricus TaxID=545624 RepID=UPI00361DB5C4